jgi:zinc protease
LVILGQVDQPALLKAAGELLGQWTAPAKYQPLANRYQKVAALNEKIETPDKENAQFEAGLRIRMSDEDPDYPAMLLANYLFGGSIASRMPNRIRNVEGLSYGASSRFSVPVDGDAALFAATVSSNPVNTPKVETCFADELSKALKSGFTPEEVAAAKKAFLDLQVVARSQDQALLRLLAAREQRGRTMAWDEQLEKKIQSLTPEQVNAAFRRHVDPAQLLIVKAGDFKKAGVFQR